jgi:hypothetical protein
MTSFLMHTWFVWWGLAIAFFLRFVHVVAKRTDQELPCRSH